MVQKVLSSPQDIIEAHLKENKKRNDQNDDLTSSLCMILNSIIISLIILRQQLFFDNLVVILIDGIFMSCCWRSGLPVSRHHDKETTLE